MPIVNVLQLMAIQLNYYKGNIIDEIATKSM